MIRVYCYSIKIAMLTHYQFHRVHVLFYVVNSYNSVFNAAQESKTYNFKLINVEDVYFMSAILIGTQSSFSHIIFHCKRAYNKCISVIIKNYQILSLQNINVLLIQIEAYELFVPLKIYSSSVHKLIRQLIYTSLIIKHIPVYDNGLVK